jgi:hypothetical protein
MKINIFPFDRLHNYTSHIIFLIQYIRCMLQQVPRQGYLHEEIPREGAVPGSHGGTEKEARGITMYLERISSGRSPLVPYLDDLALRHHVHRSL